MKGEGEVASASQPLKDMSQVPTYIQQVRVKITECKDKTEKHRVIEE